MWHSIKMPIISRSTFKDRNHSTVPLSLFLMDFSRSVSFPSICPCIDVSYLRSRQYIHIFISDLSLQRIARAPQTSALLAPYPRVGKRAESNQIDQEDGQIASPLM